MHGVGGALYPVGSVFSSAHGLQDSFIQTELQASFVEHLPLIRIPCNQPVDFHRFALSYSVTSSLSLEEKGNEWLPKKEKARLSSYKSICSNKQGCSLTEEG